jgi:hypothetical protein
VEELGVWPPVLAADDLPAHLSGVESIHATVTLADRVGLEVRVADRAAGGGAATIGKTLEIAKAFRSGESGPAAMLLRAGAERARPGPPTPGAAVTTLVWERSEIDHAFGLLAEAIQDHWR